MSPVGEGLSPQPESPQRSLGLHSISISHRAVNPGVGAGGDRLSVRTVSVTTIKPPAACWPDGYTLALKYSLCLS